MTEPGRRGWYEGTDGFTLVRIPRHVDPHLDGTALVAGRPQLFQGDLPADSVPIEDFDRMMTEAIPPDVLSRIEGVLSEAKQLAERGLADSAPIDERAWARGIVLSWSHARDLAVALEALGHPRPVAGRHDVEEMVLGKYVKGKAAHADPWYLAYLNTLKDDEPVNVGMLNPHLAASMFKWGDAKTARAQNAMDAHRLAAHHMGNPQAPVDWVEKAANFVTHHVPREHWGIRHEPRGDWAQLEPRLATDPAIRDSEVGKQIARDVAALCARLEEEGKVVPWRTLRLPAATITPTIIEHSRLVALDAAANVAAVPEEPERLSRALAIMGGLPTEITRQRALDRDDLADVYEAWHQEYRSLT